ncbi:glycoside hydrolase family 18 protein [Hymenobacter cheonanensis]|uniref:glycoside hydrolase family 18 protein n=1 Tax=Hymenobacter sp. CA2-7 TaxID=3063993 RepID=UPI002713C13C|nr:glycoside hydrolase family 18 protein [Hymenobacter sp. CA2-7]MDO7885989.1 glycoside hydrolase family 18 protein [Hymenobacter sp. CA2-7]
MKARRCLLALLPAAALAFGTPTPKPHLAVIAYYAGDAAAFQQYPTEKLTHIIYSFLHLQGTQLAFDNAQSAATVAALVKLKAQHPQLKVLLSLGGWTGCLTCSQVFSTEQGRATFAASVKKVLEATHTDGIDLDWEYPAIAGPPGHRFAPEDRHNFTLLVQTLRATLGSRYEISFAAGGFPAYLRHSVEWPAVMAVVDRVNLMSYDLVNGYSTRTGHHTPLYSTPPQQESVDDGVRFLDSVGVAPGKIVIGAAFYARVFGQVSPAANGLYQTGSFRRAVNYRDFGDSLSAAQGFSQYWDSTAQAPYAYNPRRQEFATFDDARSLRLKARYARARHLGGVMFWELTGDAPQHGLLDDLYQAAQ